LGNDESKPDFRTCCTPMEVFDKQKVKAIVKQWLLFIAEYETLPNDIIALNFNLWEAVEENGQSCYTLELTGLNNMTWKMMTGPVKKISIREKGTVMLCNFPAKFRGRKY
jgi:hypothetical protein